MKYYISDTHFGHENIIKYDAANGAKSFSSIKEHDELIINNWNRVVTKQDEVYILGDFSWLYAKETEEIIKRLNGSKFLIKGNHDRWCKDGACKKLFQGIYDYKMIQDGDKNVVLSHYPIVFYQNQHRGSIHLYGHVHCTPEEDLFQQVVSNIRRQTDIPMNCYNVGAMIEYMNYSPRTLEEIIKANETN